MSDRLFNWKGEDLDGQKNRFDDYYDIHDCFFECL